ncbi:hypothetical protein Tco_0754684 [Tanacetum coccineum]
MAALQVAEAKYARLEAASEVLTKVHAQKVAERKAIKRKQADAIIKAYKSSDGSSVPVEDDSRRRGGACEAGDIKDEEEEVREVRLVVGTKKKRKRHPPSFIQNLQFDASLVDLLINEWKTIKSGLFSKNKEARDSYLELKHRQMKMNKRRCSNNLSQNNTIFHKSKKNLSCNIKFYLSTRKERDKDLMFYQTTDVHLTGRQRESLLEIKRKIREKYNLYY